MEDEQLDELLRDVNVPADLGASLLSIPDQVDVCVSRGTAAGKLWASLGFAASIAALVFVFLYSQPTDVVINEKGDAETAELLLAEMELNLESMDLLQRIYELDRNQTRIEYSTPALSIDESVALAMSLSWKSSLDHGASVETVRDELEYVINTYPGTRGAREAANILQIN